MDTTAVTKWCLVILIMVQCACQPWVGDITTRRYTVTVVKDIPNASYSLAGDINNNGEFLITATLKTEAEPRSYVWSHGHFTEIYSLRYPKGDKRYVGGTSANAINDKGQVVGNSETAAGKRHAFLWQDGKMQDLGTLGGGYSMAYDINNAGQVVGLAINAKGEERAFLWDEKHGMRDLKIPGGSNWACHMNGKGQVIGLTQGNTASFLWQDGKGRILDSPPPTGFQSFNVLGINEKGDIVGVDGKGRPPRERRVLLYSNGKFIPVEPPQGTELSHACALTSSGLVAGNTVGTTGPAFVWQAGKSALLNDLIEPNDGWNIHSVVAMNEKGVIAACGKRKGKGHAVILTPK